MGSLANEMEPCMKARCKPLSFSVWQRAAFCMKMQVEGKYGGQSEHTLNNSTRHLIQLSFFNVWISIMRIKMSVLPNGLENVSRTESISIYSCEGFPCIWRLLLMVSG